MKNRIFILCLILCICFSIHAISAADIDSGICLESQTVEFDGTTFTELQNEINNLNDDDTIILNNDISQDADSPVEINKNITITGKNITINAQNKTNIFIIGSKNVMITNITFINGNGNMGGAIASFADLTVSNCNFIDNYAGGIYGEGGGIYSRGKLTVIDSLFENNSASAGGAIHSYATETIIETTKFINNTARWFGGAIYHDHKLRIKSCLFTNNSARSGGAIHYTVSAPSWDLNGNAIITDSNFTHNSAYFGGATSTSGIQQITYDNCNFINNCANKGAVTYKNAITRNFFNNCLIEANSAEEGGVIYDDSRVNSFDHKSIFFITNSTLKDNHDAAKASIFYARDCHIIINNTTIINNSNNPIYNGKGNITVVNSGIFNNSGIFITQFYMGNITVVNNKWDKKDPEVDEIINCTSNSTVIYSNSNLSIDSADIFNSTPLRNEMDCSSTVVRVNETEFILSHRRDGGNNYNMTVYVDHIDNYVIEFKAQLAYFFLSKVYDNGWLLGSGGLDSSAENEKVEALASDMVLNENINMESLQQILDCKKVSGTGHLLIVSPNGTYGNIITYPGNDDIIKMGILGDGDYIISPNGPTYRREGHLDNLTDPIYSNMYLSANDAYGHDRHCILVHHVTLEGGNFTDVLYCANDDGSYVGLDNGNLSCNFWFSDDYTKDSDVPIIFEKKYLGTYSHMLRDSELIISDKLIYVSDAINGFDYQIALKDKNNNPLAGKEVHVSFNGKNYTAATDSDGLASVKLAANKKGNYNIDVSFKGDRDYSQVSNNALIEVVKESVNIIGPKYASYSANEFTYRAMLKTTAGKALGNKKVTVSFNSQKYPEYSDENGYLTVTLRADAPGSYELKLEFEEDAFYEGATSFKYIQINEKDDGRHVPASKTALFDNGYVAKTLNNTIKSQNTTNTSKESKTYPKTPADDYNLAICLLALVGLGIIGIATKRRNK